MKKSKKSKKRVRLQKENNEGFKINPYYLTRGVIHNFNKYDRGYSEII